MKGETSLKLRLLKGGDIIVDGNRIETLVEHGDKEGTVIGMMSGRSYVVDEQMAVIWSKIQTIKEIR